MTLRPGSLCCAGDVFVTGGYQNLAAYLASGLDVRLSTQVGAG